MNLFIIIFGAILVNNFVLTQFLGMCPFLGVSKKTETAAGMGVAVVFVVTITSAIVYMLYNWLLVRFHLEYLTNIAFVLVIASLVQVVENFIKKSSPSLYSALGVYLPLITTNCAVLGVALLIVQKDYNFIESIVFGFASSAGFALAIVLLASIREKLEFNNIPKPLQGFPLTLFAAGLMSIAFLGFQGLIQ